MRNSPMQPFLKMTIVNRERRVSLLLVAYFVDQSGSRAIGSTDCRLLLVTHWQSFQSKIFFSFLSDKKCVKIFKKRKVYENDREAFDDQMVRAAPDDVGETGPAGHGLAK